ncbi:hypothetical protein NQ314_005880 [Rhamnusium bicolor]|uniref:Androgen-dependent TFPI-regulating protein n=1 Tax=Rhamnusium bicolor TaxID=1586634 RepID=A0AAV8ZE53_9CUCU|nr:hypothetical protein NQ314_005880 [Rhamnusium bicolor]
MGLGLQIFFLITAILDELARFLNVSVDIKKRLGRTRAFIFNTFVFPCSLLVMTIFWSIWHIDRELIFPKVVDDVYPTWLNHTLHTVIAIPLVIELLLPKRYSFVQFKNAALVLTVYMTIYQFL